MKQDWSLTSQHCHDSEHGCTFPVHRNTAGMGGKTYRAPSQVNMSVTLKLPFQTRMAAFIIWSATAAEEASSFKWLPCVSIVFHCSWVRIRNLRGKRAFVWSQSLMCPGNCWKLILGNNWIFLLGYRKIRNTIIAKKNEQCHSVSLCLLLVSFGFSCW